MFPVPATPCGFFWWSPWDAGGTFCCFVPVLLVVLLVVFVRRGGNRPEGGVPREEGPPAGGTGPPLHCTRCGTPLRPGARFCHRCGRAVG